MAARWDPAHTRGGVEHTCSSGCGLALGAASTATASRGRVWAALTRGCSAEACTVVGAAADTAAGPLLVAEKVRLCPGRLRPKLLAALAAPAEEGVTFVGEQAEQVC